MRKRSEVGNAKPEPKPDSRQLDLDGAPVDRTISDAGTTCAICKKPQHFVTQGSTMTVTCPKGHRGAFGYNADGAKMQFKDGAMRPVTQIFPEKKDLVKSPRIEEPRPGGGARATVPLTEIRTPAGTINNCALANRDSESDCQICKGKCPDRKKYLADDPLDEVVGDEDGDVRTRAEMRIKHGAPQLFPTHETGETVGPITYGKQLFSPVQYNTFEVGPFTGTTIVREGETRASATARLYSELRALAEDVFAREYPGYLERLREVARAARSKRDE